MATKVTPSPPNLGSGWLISISTLYSHQETGIQLTFDRDKSVVRFCKQHQIQWKEFITNGVKRGLSNRKTWRDDWVEFMELPQFPFQPKSNSFLPDNDFEKMKAAFEKQLKGDMESYSAYIAAESVDIPVLAIHDKDDDDVPYTASENIVKYLKRGNLYMTESLGHRKILGDKRVIETIIQFLTN